MSSHFHHTSTASAPEAPSLFTSCCRPSRCSRLLLPLLFLSLLAASLLPRPAFSQTPPAETYRRHIDDIKARLDQTSSLYAQNQIPAARETVQMAYFEVFENLEGPIRINISAKKSAQLEATFGEIRRMIGDSRPQAEIDARIAWLKKELDDVLPVLADGHQLVAQAQHDGHDNDTIAPYWKKYLQVIDDLLAESVAAYQQANYPLVRERVLQAQYDGFKNSEMEIAFRRHRSTALTSAVNLRFSALIALAARPQPPPISEYGYEVTTLLQEIAEQLPALPLVRPEHDINPDGTPATVAEAETASAVPSRDWHAVAGQINTAIAAAIASYQPGDAKAGMMAVQDAYFDLFEATGMETQVGARDTAAKTTIEGYFTRLVSLMKAGRPVAELTAQADLLASDLARAASTLGRAGGSSFLETFLYSLVIILREGLEALLIVAAIVAYLIKNNHRDKLALIRNSVLVALAASVLTAILFQWLFANSGASRELLEGFTMIAAVVVLFFMSYWLLSKTEARHWKAYLEGKLSASLSRGSLFGLWFASFLAVYREGAETVLFYFALFGDAGRSAQGALAIGAGFGAGALLLVIAYFIMRYSVVRLPLKPFFLFTGAFLYFMAFVFAGKAVLELIEGKLIQPTLIHGFPEIGWLGIHPYRETLAPQALLLIAAFFALWVMRRRRSSDHAPTPASTAAAGR